MHEGLYKMINLSKDGQKGATLITVVVLLLVITILGIIALRRSTTDLQVATAGQISKLNFQANNIAFAKIEQENRDDTKNNRSDTRNSLQGYMTRPGQQYVNAEVVLCMRPDSNKVFRLDRITEKNAQGDVLAGINNGFCDANNPAHMVSGERILTQVTFKKKEQNIANSAFSGEVVGTSSNDLASNSGASQSLCSYFDAYAVSLIPNYSNAKTSQINTCLKKRIDGSDDIATCLTELGVPHNIQVQTYRGQPTSIQCIS